MDLKPNFPSIIPEPTEEELTEVLVEFYQRGRGEVKALPPPAPFEVTTSVVQTQSSREVPVRRGDAPLDLPSNVLVEDENEVDFYARDVFPFEVVRPANIINFNFLFRCHNEGKVARPCYIRTYQNFWYWVNPITRQRLQTGLAFPSFNGTTWTPPASDQPAIDIRVSCFLQGLPPAGTFGFAGELWVNMYVEYEDTGEDMEHIYGFDDEPYPGFWTWHYPPPRSIGTIILFI